MNYLLLGKKGSPHLSTYHLIYTNYLSVKAKPLGKNMCVGSYRIASAIQRCSHQGLWGAAAVVVRLAVVAGAILVPLLSGCLRLVSWLPNSCYATGDM